MDMMARPAAEERAGNSSLGGTLGRLGASLLVQLRSRLELAAIEWQEEKLRIARGLVWLLLGVFFFQMAAVLGTLWLLLGRSDGEHRAAVIAALGLLSLGCAGAGYALWRRSLRQRPRLLEATLEELRKDEQRLRA